MINQGSIGIQNKQEGSGSPFPIGAAVNGLSVDPISFKIVLGNDVGGNTAVLLSNREIPGARAVALTQGKFGVGMGATSLATYLQNLVSQSDLWTDEDSAGAMFVRTMQTPTTPLIITTNVPGSFSVQMNLAAGSISGGAGSVVAAIKGNAVVTSNNGTKSTQQINSLVAGFLPNLVVNLAAVALLRIQSPDTSGITVAGSVIDVITGIVIEAMNSLALVGGTTFGIRQLGTADKNRFNGPTDIMNTVRVFTGVDGTNGFSVSSANGARIISLYADNAGNEELRASTTMSFTANSVLFFAMSTGNQSTNFYKPVAVNAAGAAPHASAALDVASTTQGLLLPRMTQAQRLAIATPADGLLLYQTDVTPAIYARVAGAWVTL